MWVLAQFSSNNSPATGLSPVVNIRDISNNSLVISGAIMSEVGDGFYKYNFSGYSVQEDYSILCDSVTLSGVDRYTYGSTGEYNEILSTIDSTVSGSNVKTILIEKILRNRLELADGSTDNWVLYDSDNVTPLLTFNVTDKNGNVIIQSTGVPSKRSRGV